MRRPSHYISIFNIANIDLLFNILTLLETLRFKLAHTTSQIRPLQKVGFVSRKVCLLVSGAA